MDALKLMLVSMLIGATVSLAPPEGPAQEVAALQTPASMPTQAIQFITPAPTAFPALSAPTALAATPRPTASPSPKGSITRTLKRGCEGDDVRMLQKLLMDLGYEVGVDGIYGTRTRDAVKAFQRNNGLTVDGIAGARTIRKLSGTSAIGADAAGEARGTLSYGMKGSDVKALQERLKALGYYDDACSGNYLKNTRAAVRWFQDRNGLSVDGIAGPATLARVYGKNAIAAAGSKPTAAPTRTPESGFYRTFSIGMSGSDVTYLQRLLGALGYFHERETGYFGEATLQAVVSFQVNNGIGADGIVGSQTQRMLQSPSALPYGEGVGELQRYE